MSDSNSFSTRRNFKIGSFHIGSSMADVLGSGVWNRVMIQELGFAAAPVSLLLALRYFLAPLAAWAGERSDYTNVRGYRRLPWVWGGRLGMILGYMLVAFSTVELVRMGGGWWLGLILGFVTISIGQVVSGSTFLALVYDRAPQNKRGQAVGIVWTFLLAGYAVAGVLFGQMLTDYSESAFLGFFVAVNAIMAVIWIVSVWGEEIPQPIREASNRAESKKPALMDDLRGILQQPSARMLALFMLISFVAAFMQDTLLEPFGGEAFGLSVGETTRFQAYWGTMAIVASGVALWAHRRHSYQRITLWGVLILALTFGVLTVTALTENAALLRPALLLLGVGYGLWNIGTVGLMVLHSREQNAGLDLGIWTVVATLCRGVGLFSGGLLYDGLGMLVESPLSAYGAIFALEAALLLVAIPVLLQISSSERPPVNALNEREMVLSSSMD